MKPRSTMSQLMVQLVMDAAAASRPMAQDHNGTVHSDSPSSGYPSEDEQVQSWIARLPDVRTHGCKWRCKAYGIASVARQTHTSRREGKQRSRSQTSVVEAKVMAMMSSGISPPGAIKLLQ